MPNSDQPGIISVSDVLISSDPTSNRIALQNACDTCVADGYSLYIPPGSWPAVNGGITTTDVFSIFGNGSSSILNTSGNDSLFKMTPTYAGSTPRLQCRDFFANNTIGTISQKSSSVIEISSLSAYVLYPLFSNIGSSGFYTLIKNTCGIFSDQFGSESYLNWATFESLRAYNSPNSLNAKYCVWHTNGSGTGGTYRNMKGEIDATDKQGPEQLGNPAYVRVDGGAGVVCSDIIFDGHITGKPAACISVDGNMNYRANLCVSDLTQIDATATGALIFDPPAPNAISLQITPKNIGGNIDISRNLPTLLSSTIEAQGHQYAHGGCAVDQSLVPTGPVSMIMCTIAMATAYTAMIDLYASGVVQDVAAGSIKKHFSIKHTGSAVIVTEIPQLGYTDPAGAPSEFFTITPSVSSNLVTFTLTFTAGAAGSIVAYQYEARGGGFLATRGYYPLPPS